MGRAEAKQPVTSTSGPCAQALWTKDGAAVVYPCHAVIVVLHIDTREQRFFLGHTDKVGATRPTQGRLVPVGAVLSPQPTTSSRFLPWRWMGAACCWPRPRPGPQACCASGTSTPGSACPCSGARPTSSVPLGGRGTSERGGGPAPATLTAFFPSAAFPTVGRCSAASARTATGGRYRGRVREVGWPVPGCRQSPKHLGSRAPLASPLPCAPPRVVRPMDRVAVLLAVFGGSAVLKSGASEALACFSPGPSLLVGRCFLCSHRRA